MATVHRRHALLGLVHRDIRGAQLRVDSDLQRRRVHRLSIAVRVLLGGVDHIFKIVQ